MSKTNQPSPYYLAGFDAGENGADEKNCHYSNFATIERLHDWERGKADAEKLIQSKTKKSQHEKINV
jgi:hypothetical protein